MLHDRIRALTLRIPLFARMAGETVRPARIVQALPLGPGSRLLVVEFGGRQVLVGQSRNGLAALAEACEADSIGSAQAGVGR